MFTFYLQQSLNYVKVRIRQRLCSGGGIRTPECQDQNLVPYHLATPEQKL